MPTDPVSLAVVAAVFLSGGFVKGALGLGLPVVVLALLAPALGLEAAIALLILPSMATNAWQAVAGGAFGALLARLWPFLAAASVGIWIGVGILADAETQLLEALLGGLLVVYSAFSLLRPRLPPPGRREVWISPVMGGAGGMIFGMTGIFIVPGVLYLEALGLGRDRFVQALGITFVTISAVLGTSLAGHALVSAADAAVSAGAILPALAGMTLGQSVRRRISEALFRRLFFAALILAGLYMILRAMA